MRRRPPPERRALRPLAALAAAAVLTGCTSLGPATPRAALPPPPRPAEAPVVDPLSADLAAWYRRVEDERLARNLMRSDGGAGITPAGPARLAEDHIAIALRDEHGPGGATRPSVLRRWEVPVTYVMEFGASVPRAVQRSDHAQVARLAATLGAASGHPIALAPLGGSAGNFRVLVLSESERRAAGPRLRALVPGIDDATVRLVTEMPRETFCLVMAFSRDGSAAYTEAVAVIRAEHPDLTRLACYHEELTQGLGLAADSDEARPSIFNDDQEFALITAHDLLLLRLHYDPRLAPGMTERVARPIIFAIASELAAGET